MPEKEENLLVNEFLVLKNKIKFQIFFLFKNNY
jgi:hypothetical protein